VAPSGRPATESTAAAHERQWPVVVALLAFAGAVRALRFWSVISWAHWDEANVAVPAIQILGGTFPVHHVGVEYHGAAVAYALAVWFAVAGVSTVALDVFCYAVGLGFVGTGFLVARRVLPPGAALVALAVLAVPPLLLAHWALSGNLNYPLTLVIGNLLVLGTHTIFFRRSGQAAPLLALGLLAGVGWWSNPLVVLYCAPFAVLALRTGLVRRRVFWLFPLGVALGGLPDWIYEAVHFPSARFLVHEAGSLPPQSIGLRAAQLFGDIALALHGARPVDGFVPPLGAQVGVMALGALVVARAAVRDRAELRWLAGRRGRPGRGLGILWALLAANLLAVLLTKRTLGANYLLPLYGVLPIWTGECLWWLWRRRRWVGASAIAGLLAFHLWANWAVTLGRGSRATLRWAPLHAQVRPLADWLTARGIRRVYWAPDSVIWAYEFSYLTGMRVIAAHLWAESVVQHAHAVDADPAPPIVTTENRLATLRSSLGGLSLRLEETPVAGFVVVEARPARPRGFAPIAPGGWRVAASHRSHEAMHLVDRDAGTGWSTGQRQAPGQWLLVDLGGEEEVARLDLLSTDSHEVPAGFRVEWSRDGGRWAEAVSVPQYWGPLFWSERHAFLKVRRGRIQAVFEPVRARFLRVALTAGSSRHAWAAREVFVYRPAPPPPAAVLPEGELAAGLRREGVGFVYASPWLSARVRVESGEAMGALESNAAVNSYGRVEPAPSALERFRLRADRAVLLGEDADGAGVRDVLRARGAIAREAAVGPYRLLLLAPGSALARVSRDGWQGRASVASATAARAVDEDPATRWTAGQAVDHTASFTVDLGRPRPLRGLRLAPGSREGGPSDFRLDGSADGVVWRPLEPETWTGPLYWTGSELLRNGRPEWSVSFPPVTVRAVRIRPAAPAPTWSIADITAFE
jgi:hypothetical protein